MQGRDVSDLAEFLEGPIRTPFFADGTRQLLQAPYRCRTGSSPKEPQCNRVPEPKPSITRLENVSIAKALQLEAARRRAVPIRFNFVARAKFELAQPIRCRLRAFFLLIRCLLYTSPSPRDGLLSRMPSSA